MRIPNFSTAHSQLLLNPKELLKSHVGTIVVLGAYLVFYVYIIIKGNGIPYVMDNNETFSALVHAYNLWHFDFLRSFGLADEAVSPFAAAHPMVHTHQGDFPRLFSFLLFGLGARTAAAQIWITTFTIGIASVLMAKSFFRRLGGDLFATIATVFLIGDYLLFAQWQVNTYRIWHGFFLFGSLMCVHGLSEWKRSSWAIATILLYACLFYWEIVFATFVAISTGIYAIWYYRRTPRLIFLVAAVQIFGAALALAILTTQNVLYLGWHDFIIDFKQTYGARNLGIGIDDVKLKRFYSSRNVIFWPNFEPESNGHGFTALLQSIFSNVLQVQTPCFVLIALCPSIAAFLVVWRPKKGGGDTDLGDPLRSSDATITLGAGLFCFLATQLFGDAIFGKPLSVNLVTNLELGVVMLCAPFFAIALRHIARMISTNKSLPGVKRCALANCYLVGLSILIIAQGFFYDQTDQNLWFGLLTIVKGWQGKALITIIVFFCTIVVLAGRIELKSYGPMLSSVGLFVCCGLFAYVLIFEVSAGYLYSGYLFRLCPFLVFHIDAFLALGPTILVAVSLNVFSECFRSRSNWPTKLFPVVGTSLAIMLVFVWANVQLSYLKFLPPTRFAFLRHLDPRLAANSGIIANTFPLPFGFTGKTWAYMDPQFGADGSTHKDFLWLADHNKNESYRFPGVFVCFESFGFFHRLIDPSDRRFYLVPRCSELNIALRTSDPKANKNPHVSVMARDHKNDLWAIYRLNWNASN